MNYFEKKRQVFHEISHAKKLMRLCGISSYQEERFKTFREKNCHQQNFSSYDFIRFGSPYVSHTVLCRLPLINFTGDVFIYLHPKSLKGLRYALTLLNAFCFFCCDIKTGHKNGTNVCPFMCLNLFTFSRWLHASNEKVKMPLFM